MDMSPVGAKLGGRPSLKKRERKKRDQELWDVQDGEWNYQLYGVYGVVG